MTEHHHGNEEEEQQAPPEKKVGSLPPRLAARIRRQQARRRLQERATQLGVPPGEEEEGPPSGDQPGQERAPEAEELVEVKAGPTDEPQPERPPVPEAEPPQAAPAPPLAPESPTLAPPVRLDAAPSTRPRAIVRREPAERPAPTKGRAADLRLRRFPTVTGVVQELGRGAWESVTALIASHLQRLKRRRILVERDHAFLTEDDLLERRPKVRGYVLASTIIHLLLFLPLISLAMIQEPEKKPPVFVRLLETPPPAKKIEKQKKNAESEKTTKRTTKVVKARGPRPAPRPVARPTVRKAYVSPKKVLVAKATQPTLKTTAPAIPKVAPARLEAPRHRSAPARLPQETVTKIAAPTRPVVLPKTPTKVTSVTETLERQTPKEARPTVLEKDVAAVPDTEGRLSRLSDAFPKEFQVSDRLIRPTAPPPMPPTRAPAPSVLGQAAPVVSEATPASASPLAPRVASSEARASNARPVAERRTARDVEARLGRETGPVSPTQPVSFDKTNELGPISSAPTEFREEITVPLNSDDPRFKEYLEAVKRRILEVWRYPDDAEPGLQGRVSIEFSIERDGSVSRVVVNRTSGFTVLDRGATDAMHRASPFLPLPPEFKTNRLNVEGAFRYN